VPSPELHQVVFDGKTTAHVLCEHCGFHADALDSAQVQSALADGAMHAMSMGLDHVVTEHVIRDVTVRPVP
jgi:hypothetical protein